MATCIPQQSWQGLSPQRQDREEAMWDNAKLQGPKDRTRISTTEDYELLYWSQTLGLSAEDLKNLVAQYGNSVDAVRQVLGKRACQRAH
jgi:hypothetical protein